HFAELSEDECFFAPGSNFLTERFETHEFSTVGCFVASGFRKLIRMVTDLFEAHEVSEDEPTPLDAGGLLQTFSQCVSRLLIEPRLGWSQTAKYFHFRLVRQIGDDRFIRLEAPQNVR